VAFSPKNIFAVMCFVVATGLHAQSYAPGELAGVDLPSRMRPYIERFASDRGALTRKFPIEMSLARRERMRGFYREWLEQLRALPFDTFEQHDRVDHILFREYLEYQVRQLDLESAALETAGVLLPFAGDIVALDEALRRMEFADARKSAAALDALVKSIRAAHRQAEEALKNDPPKRSVALRAAAAAVNLRNTLKHWFDFYHGYDPAFTWWSAEPYKAADGALLSYSNFLRERIGGVRAGDREAIAGNPIGREALLSELAHEMIPYTPEELIEIANKEFAWCENEMRRASRDLGYGDDWKKALEHVKNQHVEPGQQPLMILELAREAEKYMDDHNLVTIPNLARETWRMEMMSPERQLLNPFFLGGEQITVSFPTNTMNQEQRRMSMRANNVHFSRATVFHELIPGHHLQGFMNARYRPYRALFATPFSTEGWALYWELLLWDMNFAKSAENRIGMLFWRMHRCARIIFSLNFHLEKMTEKEAVDFLVERVGHERSTAEGEVRRSFAGAYSPLYQAAYLLGGLQIYSLHKELVKTGKMTPRAFHDAILREHKIPIEMLRASLLKIPVSREYRSSWRFYGD
jgi:hypothetical protein